jgi:hypothetical protein
VGNRCVMGGFGTGEDTAELPWFSMSGQELGSPSVQTRPSDHSPSSAGTPPDPPDASNARTESVTSASAPSQLPPAHLTQEAALLRDALEKMLPGVDAAVREDLIALMLASENPWAGLKKRCLACAHVGGTLCSSSEQMRVDGAASSPSEAPATSFEHVGVRSPEFVGLLQAALTLPAPFALFHIQVKRVCMCTRRAEKKGALQCATTKALKSPVVCGRNPAEERRWSKP